MWDAALTRAPCVVVPACAIGPEHAVVPGGTIEALDAVDASGRSGTMRDAWLLGGVGRVLPGRLYDALRAACAPARDAYDGAAYEEVPLARFARCAGPRGLERPADAAARIDCAVVPELLRPLD